MKIKLTEGYLKKEKKSKRTPPFRSIPLGKNPYTQNVWK